MSAGELLILLNQHEPTIYCRKHVIAGSNLDQQDQRLHLISFEIVSTTYGSSPSVPSLSASFDVLTILNHLKPFFRIVTDCIVSRCFESIF